MKPQYLYVILASVLALTDGKPQIPEGLGDTISSLGSSAATFIRNGDPSKILKGTSTLIDGLAGNENNNSTNSTNGIGDIATNVLIGSTRVSGEILENQPVIADTGKEISAGAIDIGSKIAGEVAKRPDIVEGLVSAGKGAGEVGKTLSNVFQGLFG